MEVGKKLYVTDRKAWRRWLAKNHKTAPDIWLVYYKKGSGKDRIPYNDAVEEALCYGWIDSLTKPRNKESWVQRFSPRRKKSPLSEMNKERVRRLIEAGTMTRFGLESISHHLDGRSKKKGELKKFIFPHDIIRALKKDPEVWKHFNSFPESYRRIRVGWIDGTRNRPDFFEKRLRYFIKMTAKNKKFGMVQ